MKMNGIIRRVDNLGRVVIPREYRKLHKISLGDPMEISCRDNGEIVMRKVDMTLTLEEFSMSVIKLLSAQMGITILVSNLEEFVCGSGNDKTIFVGNSLPAEVKQNIAGRKSMSTVNTLEKWGFDIDAVITSEPIIGESDVFGCLFAVSNQPLSAENVTLLKITAAVLGSSLQKY